MKQPTKVRWANELTKVRLLLRGKELPRRQPEVALRDARPGPGDPMPSSWSSRNGQRSEQTPAQRTPDQDGHGGGGADRRSLRTAVDPGQPRGPARRPGFAGEKGRCHRRQAEVLTAAPAGGLHGTAPAPASATTQGDSAAQCARQGAGPRSRRRGCTRQESTESSGKCHLHWVGALGLGIGEEEGLGKLSGVGVS